MSDPIRELLADLPLADMLERPEGMLAIRRADVPDADRPTTDAWVEEHGGHIAQVPLFQVHNGKTPDSPGGEEFYVLPPSAFRG
jgi:hypothetical protein